MSDKEAAGEAAEGAAAMARPKRQRAAVKAAVFLLAASAVAISLPALGVSERLVGLRAWIEGLGAAGPLVFAGIYAVATVAAVPASLLTLAAGAMFGSVVGIASVAVGATAGAAAAFAIARWLARDAVAAWLGRSARFAKLDAMTERHGAIIVAITRLVPIFPFNLLNYGFGLTRVRFGTYLLWSFLCMLPGIALYVVGADALTRAVAEGQVPWGAVAALAGIVALLLAVVHRARALLAAREAAREGAREGAREAAREPGGGQPPRK